MAASSLALSMAVGLVGSFLYLYIGVVLGRRVVSREARLARDLFAAWWIILGAMGLLSAGQLGLYLTGSLPVWLFLTLSQLSLALVFTALWALQCYLVYLYRGTRKAFLPLAVFYLLLYVFVVGLIHWIGQTHPYTSISDNGWTLVAMPRFELDRGVGLVTVLVLLGPQLAAAFAYSRLFFKTHDRTQRYRIALLSGAIIGWFGASLVASAADVDPGNITWQVVSRLIGLVAALVILAAYKPPAFLRRRGIRSIDDDAAAGSAAAAPA